MNDRLIGILESSGSFQVNVTKNTRYNSGYALGIGYVLIHKDPIFLVNILAILANNNIHGVIKDKKLIINGLNNINIFNVLIENEGGFISVTKQFQFLQWKEIFKLVCNKQHLTIDGIEKIIILKNKMK